MDFSEVEEKINNAIKSFKEENRKLLEVEANERSLTHKLAECLQREFVGVDRWDVDCEYNRDGFDAKRLDLTTTTLLSDDDKGTTVYPDIIVHKRLSGENLLVIEVKKVKEMEGDYEYDRKKLHAFLGQLGYKFAVFLKFHTNLISITWERVEKNVK